MSDAIQHIDVDSDEFSEAPKALRDHVKKLQGRLTELSTETQTLRQQITARALDEVLADKGFKNPARVQRDMLSDQINPADTAAVEAWLASNADDYARAAAAPDPAPVQTDTPPAEAGALAAINSTADLRSPVSTDKWERALAEITPEMTGADIKAVYAKHGV